MVESPCRSWLPWDGDADHRVRSHRTRPCTSPHSDGYGTGRSRTAPGQRSRVDTKGLRVIRTLLTPGTGPENWGTSGWGTSFCEDRAWTDIRGSTIEGPDMRKSEGGREPFMPGQRHDPKSPLRIGYPGRGPLICGFHGTGMGNKLTMEEHDRVCWQRS